MFLFFLILMASKVYIKFTVTQSTWSAVGDLRVGVISHIRIRQDSRVCRLCIVCVLCVRLPGCMIFLHVHSVKRSLYRPAGCFVLQVIFANKPHD